jgi:hypothetical protein
MAYKVVLIVGAARCNALAVVQFLRAQDCLCSYAVFRLAAARGDTDMCAYLRTEARPCSEAACVEAAFYSHASNLRWLREHNAPWNTRDSYLAAARSGSVDVLHFLLEEPICFTDPDLLKDMLRAARAEKGYLQHSG